MRTIQGQIYQDISANNISSNFASCFMGIQILIKKIIFSRGIVLAQATFNCINTQYPVSGWQHEHAYENYMQM